MDSKFGVFLATKNGENAQSQVHLVTCSKSLARELKAIYTDPTVSPLLIRAILEKLIELEGGLELAQELILGKSAGRGRMRPWRKFYYEVSLETLREFLRVLKGTQYSQYPGDIVLPGNVDVSIALNGLWDGFLFGDEDDDALKETSETALLSVSSPQDLDRHPELNLLWQRSEVLLRAFMQRDIDDPSEDGRPWLVAHAIAKTVSPYCAPPPIALWFALRLFPNQIHTWDYLGRTPLHYIVSQGHDVRPRRHSWGREVPEEIPGTNVSLVEMIRNHFPEAGRFADSEGRLPLNTALTNVGEFHGWCRDNTLWQSVVWPLVEMAPQALVTRDPTTRLYPFQLAATDPNVLLGVIYGLLRENPAVLARRNATETEIRDDARIRRSKRLAAETVTLHRQLAATRATQVALRQEIVMLKEELERRKRARTS